MIRCGILSPRMCARVLRGADKAAKQLDDSEKGTQTQRQPKAALQATARRRWLERPAYLRTHHPHEIPVRSRQRSLETARECMGHRLGIARGSKREYPKHAREQLSGNWRFWSPEDSSHEQSPAAPTMHCVSGGLRLSSSCRCMHVRQVEHQAQCPDTPRQHFERRRGCRPAHI